MLMWLLKFTDWMNEFGRKNQYRFIPSTRTWANDQYIRSRRELTWMHMKWADIDKIWMIRQEWYPDKYYVFFNLHDAGDGYVTICDVDTGFAEVMAIFPQKIEGCSGDWLTILGPDLDEWKLLWSRNAAESHPQPHALRPEAPHANFKSAG